MIATVLGAISGKMVVYGGMLIAVVVAFFGIKKSGVQQQQNADMRGTIKNIGVRDAVDHEVDAESDADVARDLQRNQRKQ